jgi:hypothetical protein
MALLPPTARSRVFLLFLTSLLASSAFAQQNASPPSNSDASATTAANDANAAAPSSTANDANAAANSAVLLPWRTVARAWAKRRDCDETWVAELQPENVVVTSSSAPPPTNSTGSGLVFACLRRTDGQKQQGDNDNDKDDQGTGKDNDNDQDDNNDNNKELVWRVGVCSMQNYTGAAIFDAPKGQVAQQPVLSVEPFGPGGAAPSERAEPLTIGEEECRIIDGRGDEQSMGTAEWSKLVKDLRAGNIYVAAKTVENPSGEIRGQLEALKGGDQD